MVTQEKDIPKIEVKDGDTVDKILSLNGKPVYYCFDCGRTVKDGHSHENVVSYEREKSPRTNLS